MPHGANLSSAWYIARMSFRRDPRARNRPRAGAGGDGAGRRGQRSAGNEGRVRAGEGRGKRPRGWKPNLGAPERAIGGQSDRPRARKAGPRAPERTGSAAGTRTHSKRPDARTRRRDLRRPGPAVLEADAAVARWPDVTSLLKRQPWDVLKPPLLKIGADLEAVMPRLRRYCEMLVQWNRKVSNLISRNDETRIVARHVLESLEPAHWLHASGAKRWLDFGSGSGFPAIPLAISGVGSEWTLVESRRTKTLFLRKAVEELAISGVTVIQARLEDIANDHAGTYGGFTSRATQTLVPTLAIAASVVQPGGTAFLWKGSRREAEMTSDESWRASWEFEGLQPIGDGTTAVARFTRK